MEKKKSKNGLLKFLPKAASAVKFQNPPFSPGKLKIHAGKGYSGHCTSIIPAEARRNPRNSTTTFESQEPTSPKVTCMGQIKHNKKMIKKEKLGAPHPRDSKPVSALIEAKKKNTATYLNVLFNGAKPPRGRKSDVSCEKSSNLPDLVPSLSQMRRFASGREAIRDFDWGTDVKPVEEDSGNYYSGEESEGEDRERLIPFSAPILGGGGGGMAMEPRKEINLWKRRTMAQPSPLQINSLAIPRNHFHDTITKNGGGLTVACMAYLDIHFK